MVLGQGKPRTTGAARLLLSATVAALSCCAPRADYSPGHARAVAKAPYLAVNSRRPTAFPEASNRGSFEIANNCVVFRRAGDGVLFTPIFPARTRIISTASAQLAILLGSSEVPLGKEVRLSGGYLDAPTGGNVSLAAPVASSCPTRFWLVGSVM